MATRRAVPSPPKLKESLMLLRLALHRVTGAGVEEGIRGRLTRREEMFLTLAERHIFQASKSPYRPLFDLAGYGFARLRRVVLTEGLDAALDQLWRDGVYITIREFKGQEPARRGPHTFSFQQGDFANADVAPVLQSWSSGSRGGGTRSASSAEGFVNGASLLAWLYNAYGFGGRDIVFWLPPRMGLGSLLSHIAMGRPPKRWFSFGPIDRTYTLLARAAGLLTRQSVPLPRQVLPDGVLEIARYLAAENTGGMVVMTMISSALRLVRAAGEASLNLGDVVFVIGGEPLTPAKQRQFALRGYPVVSAFSFNEFGMAGWSCPHSRDPDDLHVFTDRLALRQYPRPVEGNGATVQAYLFTSLLPDARHIMVNMESGDYGEMGGSTGCGCFLERAGLHQHMHTIRSFEKLTAEGMTFFGPTLIGLLEEVLPREFGGREADYQLVEAEDSGGQTRMYLLASPELGALDEEALKRTVLREIRERNVSPGAGRQIQQMWERAETIQVLRRRPLETITGKIHHLHRHEGILVDREEVGAGVG